MTTNFNCPVCGEGYEILPSQCGVCDYVFYEPNEDDPDVFPDKAE